MLHTEKPSHLMDGIVRGIPKRTMPPIVDGIITGVPRKAHPAIATPTEKAPGPCATGVPKNAFGSGVFGEGAGHAPKGSSGPERHDPKKGTTKGEMRKTARRAYEPK